MADIIPKYEFSAAEEKAQREGEKWYADQAQWDQLPETGNIEDRRRSLYDALIEPVVGSGDENWHWQPPPMPAKTADSIAAQAGYNEIGKTPPSVLVADDFDRVRKMNNYIGLRQPNPNAEPGLTQLQSAWPEEERAMRGEG